MSKKNFSLELLNFSRWSGTGFSIFNSLGKNLKICALSIACLSSFTNAYSVNNTDSSAVANVKVEEVVVSASKSPKMLSELARLVEIVPKSEIVSAPAQTLNDLLEHSLNIDIRQRGSGDIQSDLSFRGGSFNQSLVLLNGAKLIASQTGHHSLDLPINFESVDKIEILHGPGAKFFGANASNGAINVITNPDKKENFTAGVVGGQHGYLNAYFGANLNLGILKNYISFAHKKSDGYITNTDYETYNFYMTNSIKFLDTKYFLQTGYNKKEFGANSFYTAKYPNQFEKTSTFFINLQSQKQFSENFSVRTSTSYRKHWDEFQLYRESFYDTHNRRIGAPENTTDTIPSWYKHANHHLSSSFSNEGIFNFKSKIGETNFSYEYRNTSIKSNVLGKKMSSPEKISGVSNTEYTKEERRENISLFLEHGTSFRNFHVNGGIMYNINSDYGNNYSSGIDLSYQIKNSNIFASINQSLRLPTFTELYYKGGGKIGNQDLEAEKSTTYEIGYNYKNKIVTVQSAIYNRRTDSQIDWVKNNGDANYISKNYGKINAYGFEFSSKLNTNSFFFTKKFIESLKIKFSHNQIDNNSNGYDVSLYVMDYIKNKLSLDGKHKIIYNFALSWMLSWQDRNGTYTSRNGSEIAYEPYEVLDVKLSWQQQNYLIYLEASNLLDKEYRDFGHLVQPGRWIKLGFKYNINL
jgi:iron complex outermembrane receptor protein